MDGFVFETVKGWMGVATSADQLAYVTRPYQTQDQARGELDASFLEPLHFEMPGQGGLAERFAAKINAYFAGERVLFDELVDFSRLSRFDRQVLEVVRSIPFAEVRSYAWVAAQIGHPNAARPVGQAVGRNPVPIVIPCHRVIGSDGGLRGFGWGLEMKRWLLDLETSM